MRALALCPTSLVYMHYGTAYQFPLQLQPESVTISPSVQSFKQIPQALSLTFTEYCIKCFGSKTDIS